MRLSISARFSIKDRPEGYLGLTGEHWNFGKDNALSLSEMCCAILHRIFWYYGIWLQPEQMTDEVVKVTRWLSEARFSAEDPNEQEINNAGTY